MVLYPQTTQVEPLYQKERHKGDWMMEERKADRKKREKETLKGEREREKGEEINRKRKKKV